MRFAAGFLLLLAAARVPAAEKLPAPVREFFDTHCVGCHSDAAAKAKLSVESLPPAFDRPAWVRIHDRLAAHEMPPKGKPQPTAAELARVTDWLAKELTAAAAARQKTDGRVVFRRMNRREYETTLHDLLGIATPLQHLLPEDNPVHGFDTVSSGLETSSAHLLQYQRAAEVAVDAALPRGPLESKTVRITGKKYLDGRLPVHRKGIDPFVRVDGEALVLHARLYGDNSMHAPHPLVPGRYRVRASVRLVNTDGKPMTVLVGKRVDRFQAEKLMHVVDYRDVTPGGPQVLEVETDIGYSQGNQFIYFEGMSLPWFGDFAKGRGAKANDPLDAGFAGPGLAIDWAELEGPLGAGVGVKRLFGDLPRVPGVPAGQKPPANWEKLPANDGHFHKWPLAAKSADPKADADRLVRGFLPRAFRRPVSDALAAHYVKFVHDRLAAGDSFDEAMRAGYKTVLCSAHFLNYVEPPGRLDDHAVAARLARFLWNAGPDEELTAAATAGKLRTPDGLRAQTERMLKDRKSARFARSFTDQWLDLGKFLDMKPDAIYAEYDDLLAWSMPLETRKFFDEVLAADLPTSSFVHTDWTFLNARLAQHYGVPGVTGTELRKVTLKPESHRGGVLTHASVLKLTTNASYTSPVKRGAWVLERLVGTPPPPPPPDVKAVEPDIRGATTIREQLAKHKDVAVCASCHVKIDPPGFALENFDVVGGWRDRYRVKQGGSPGTEYVDLPRYAGKKVWLAKPVQADGETADGKTFRNVDEFKQLLLRDPDQLTRNLAEKLVVYATGAGLDFADRATVEQIVRDAKAKNHGFRSLIHAVVQSPAFLNK